MDPKQRRVWAFQRHIARLERRLVVCSQLANRFAWIRLIVFVAGVALTVALLALAGSGLAVIGGVLGLAGYVAVARHHHHIKNSILRLEEWLAIKRTHLARMILAWDDLPPALIATPRPERPVERDLDLVGERSLLRLIDTAVSSEGGFRLADWLATTVPDVSQIQQRQALVRELHPLVVFRDRLAVNARLLSGRQRRRWDSGRLLQWLQSEDALASLERDARWLSLLAVVNAVLFALTVLTGLLPLWQISFVVYITWYLWKAFRITDPFRVAQALSDPLQMLQSVFGYLETCRYGQNRALRTLCEPFVRSTDRPSAHLAGITRLLSAASLRHNPPFWFLASVLVPWDLLVLLALQRRQAALAAILPRWLDVWFELEAACSLANFGFLNPDFVFPEVLADAKGEVVFEVRAAGHPLIPDDERVCNDFVLSRPGEMGLITGSNMSGKSTFLRTLGVNLCLTYAGGPVNARSFRVTPLRLYTCIRVTDSVTDGISYFYAEVKRLKGLLTALDTDQSWPVFYLIDEIFRGTNNNERLIGSRAYVRTLVGKKGIGVLSTHDLELVHLADELPLITNYHFEEHIQARRMSFDYLLRPGPCPTTNALRIMQMEGLPVDGEA